MRPVRMSSFPVILLPMPLKKSLSSKALRTRFIWPSTWFASKSAIFNPAHRLPPSNRCNKSKATSRLNLAAETTISIRSSNGLPLQMATFKTRKLCPETRTLGSREVLAKISLVDQCRMQVNSSIRTPCVSILCTSYFKAHISANQQYQQQGGQDRIPEQANSQPMINPATGQPDYSSQWIEYYRR